mmetsp:Transcript_93206/g.263493  ORF Transcript_93206/g.263493 Transcript_93206/m.263493 type:complete len:305 (+) Transcript_93206:809-1723(+)
MQLLIPTGKHVHLLLLEEPRVQNRRRPGDAEPGLDHPGTRVELLQDALQRLQILGGHEVGLVEDQDIRNLDLVDQQADDASLVALLRAQLLPVDKAALAAEVCQKVPAVDDRDQRVEPGHTADPGVAHLVRGREGARHWQGLRDARALDEQVVEAPLQRQLTHTLHEILPQGAADAAILQLNHLVLVVVQLHPVLQQLSIDVDRRHVVDKHCDTLALTIVQNVCQQRRLACTEEAAQNSDGQLLLVFQAHQSFSLLRRDAIDCDDELLHGALGGVRRSVHARLRSPAHAASHEHDIACARRVLR